MNRRNERGFTAIELTVAATINVVIIGLAFSIAHTVADNHDASSHQLEIRSEMRQGVEGMVRELQLASRSSAVIRQENGSSRLDFVIPAAITDGTVTWSDTISFRVEPSSSGVDGVLVRVCGDQRRYLCRRVPEGGLVFEKQGDNVIVRLRVATTDAQERPIEETSETTVLLRNP